MGLLHVFIALTVFIVVESRYALRMEWYDEKSDELMNLDKFYKRNQDEHIPESDPKDEAQRSFESVYGENYGVPLVRRQTTDFMKRYLDLNQRIENDMHLNEKIAGIYRKLREKTEDELLEMQRTILEAKSSNLTTRNNLEIEGIPLNLKDEEFAERNGRNFYDELTEEIDLQLRGTTYPYSYGMDIGMLEASHPFKAVRPGEATDTDSCDKITKIPSDLQKNFKPKGIPTFYQKYTEVYNIPIIGSKFVTDEGLRSACYTVRYLLADRFDIRNCYYKLWGRFALIADNEQTTSLVEYSNYAKTYDSRTRGLGGTKSIPMCSAGDDNCRCKPGDRYFDQNILQHEAAHGLHQLGATYVLPGFENRLRHCFETMVVKGGKWKSSYAAENRNEYFATLSQFWHQDYNEPGKYATDFKVKDRASLKVYDKCGYALLEEVFPCGNYYVSRCDWKKCDAKNYKLVYDISVKAKCECDEVKCTYKLNDEDSCANYGCYMGANVINFKPGVCRAMLCDKTDTNADLKLSQKSGEYNILKVIKKPVMDFAKELGVKLKTDCTVGYISSEAKRSLGKRGKKGGKKKSGGSKNTSGGTSGACANAASNNFCGDQSTTNENKCKARGCCWVGGKCRYGNPRCVNRNINCPELAKDQCDVDVGFMLSNCALACDKCDALKKYKQSDLDNMCQNKDANCWPWEKIGECAKNPSFMNSRCPVSCKKC